MDEAQLFYDLLTINIISLSATRQIDKLNGPHIWPPGQSLPMLCPDGYELNSPSDSAAILSLILRSLADDRSQLSGGPDTGQTIRQQVGTTSMTAKRTAE